MKKTLSELELKQVLKFLCTNGRICTSEIQCSDCVFRHDEFFSYDNCGWNENGDRYKFRNDNKKFKQEAANKLLNSTYFDNLSLIDILELLAK